MEVQIVEGVTDRDKDGLLIDDILKAQERDLTYAAVHLIYLGRGENVSATGDPKDPRVMRWTVNGVDRFELVKEDGYMTYRELTGTNPDTIQVKGNNYSLLFGLNPWLVKSDVLANVNPWDIRNPWGWIANYIKTASAPILDEKGVAAFNARDSSKVEKVDYSLSELPDGMPLKDVVSRMFTAYLLESNVHIVGEGRCNLGVASKDYAGDLDTKSEDNRWSIKDWEDASNAYGLDIVISDVDPKVCPGVTAGRITLDFSGLARLTEEIDIGYGIIVNQTDLRAIPNRNSCYDSPGETSDDGCEFHRPHIEPVRILWKGKGWYFVKTQQEYGWVREEDVAVAERKDVEKLLAGRAVVKEFDFIKDGVRYGMGTHLPLIKRATNDVTVEVPGRGKDGRVVWRTEKMPAHYFLVDQPYTYSTVVKALLSETTKGVWLLANKPFKGVEGVDCSGATKMAAEVAGLLLGRNSGSAQGIAGKGLWERPKELVLENQTDPAKQKEAWVANVERLRRSKEEITKVLESWHKDMIEGRPRGVLLLGWQGHISVFLGLDSAHRPVVVSSLSRVQRILEPNPDNPHTAKTDNVWMLGTVVTPLPSLEVDPLADQMIPASGGRPYSWFGKITYIRELIPN